jgi:predicted hotdog family 3-hydroxylacyl-ACP dehydratase
MSFIPLSAAEFIPQREPFILVDRLLNVDEKTCLTSFRITEDNLFVKEGYYSTPGMVESMAQTAAAGTGYLSKKANRPVPIGYIGAVQKLEVSEWPPVKANIEMEVRLITNILQVSLVSAVVRYNGNIMASCEMKIFITNQS